MVGVAADDQVLGHILFSLVTTTPLSEAQGIGSGLIREGLRISKEIGYDYCVVLGNPQYYERFGFQKASHFGLENEYAVDDEFMIIRFSANQFLEDHVPRRLVRYAPEFALFCL